MSNAPVRILVTRPEPGASATARRLEAAGFRATVLPLTRIVPVAPGADALEVAGKSGAVAVTSASAFRHMSAELAALLTDKPLFAVGEATAEAARKAGFAEVHNARGDASALASMLGRTLPAAIPVAFVTGTRRVSTLEQELAANGHTVGVIEVYATELVSRLTDIDRRSMRDAPDVILLHSQSAAEALAELPGTDRSLLVHEKTRFFAMSDRVAEILPGQWQARTTVAATPDDVAMIKAVMTHFAGRRPDRRR